MLYLPVIAINDSVTTPHYSFVI